MALTYYNSKQEYDFVPQWITDGYTLESFDIYPITDDLLLIFCYAADSNNNYYCSTVEYTISSQSFVEYVIPIVPASGNEGVYSWDVCENTFFFSNGGSLTQRTLGTSTWTTITGTDFGGTYVTDILAVNSTTVLATGGYDFGGSDQIVMYQPTLSATQVSSYTIPGTAGYDFSGGTLFMGCSPDRSVILVSLGGGDFEAQYSIAIQTSGTTITGGPMAQVQSVYYLTYNYSRVAVTNPVDGAYTGYAIDEGTGGVTSPALYPVSIDSSLNMTWGTPINMIWQDGWYPYYIGTTGSDNYGNESWTITIPTQSYFVGSPEFFYNEDFTAGYICIQGQIYDGYPTTIARVFTIIYGVDLSTVNDNEPTVIATFVQAVEANWPDVNLAEFSHSYKTYNRIGDTFYLGIPAVEVTRINNVLGQPTSIGFWALTAVAPTDITVENAFGTYLGDAQTVWPTPTYPYNYTPTFQYPIQLVAGNGVAIPVGTNISISIGDTDYTYLSLDACTYGYPAYDGITTNPVPVIYDLDGIDKNAGTFNYFFPPQITSITPDVGDLSTVITITGLYFDQPSNPYFTTTLTTIEAQGETYSTSMGENGGNIFDVISDTEVQVPVPPLGTLETANIVLTNGIGNSELGEEGSQFTFSQPVVTTFTPTSGTVGTEVTITGLYFGGLYGVQFNGVNAAFTQVSDTEVTAIVPNIGATQPTVSATVAVLADLGAGTGNSQFIYTQPSASATDWSYDSSNPTPPPPVYQIYEFDNTSTPGSYPIIVYQWELSDGTRSQEQEWTHTFADNGVYTVTLTVIDAIGNQAQTSQTVTVSGQTGTTVTFRPRS